VGGYLDCRRADTKAAFPRLTTVGGWLDCRGADTKAAFPRLTTVGGWLDCRGADTKAAFPRLKKTDVGSSSAQAKVWAAFRRKGFLFADGILSRIVETKQAKSGAWIHKLRALSGDKVSYCIEVDGTFAHGDTLQEARESLLYKVGDRDKSKYAGWALDKKITARDAIESYRVITGACEAGVRQFVRSQGGLKKSYTVQEVIDITKGQYGNEAYAKFFETVGKGK
jgi:hypothetical protein